MKKMGGLSSILGMMPGLGWAQARCRILTRQQPRKLIAHGGDHLFHDAGGETESPLLNPSRKRRIAVGAGVDIRGGQPSGEAV